MTQYPGHDPDDPFAKPPKEGGAHAGDETAPISGATPPPPPPPPAGSSPAEEEGYWERQAREQGGAQTSNPWAGYGEPAGQAGPAAPIPPVPPTPAGSYPAPSYGQQPYGQPGYVAPPNHPQSTTALVLGIVSIACCSIAGPFAWVIGGRARREIRESQGQLGGDGAATAGWIMGIVGTVLMVLTLLFVVVAVVIGLASAGTGGSSTNF